ncbi:MAG: twin-arginine translocase TatA/TatE family subunit [Bryobacteraceae bacterium]
MGPLGWQETVFIFVLALLIFGPKKLPELGRNVAKAISEFRRASSELKAQFDREMSTLERESESIKEVTQSYTNDIYNSYNDSSYYDEGAYGSDSYDSTATNPSNVSASATQGAESTANAEAQSKVAPEGAVARATGTEAAPAETGAADGVSDPKLAQTAATPSNGTTAHESSAPA